MISFEWLEASVVETGEPAGVHIHGHMLAALWIDDALLWALDGELISADEARMILRTYT